jgi:hypothetical protein
LKRLGVTYPKSNDPSLSRGVSIPESLWERLKVAAKAERRSTSSYICLLLEEALSTDKQRQGQNPENPTKLPQAKRVA